MELADFDYSLPKELIAQEPVSPRDSARLMVLNRATRTIEHRRFGDVLNYLDTNDVIVLNNTKVLPVRLFGHREFTGGKVEILLLPVSNHQSAIINQQSEEAREVLLRPSKRIKVGEKILLNHASHWAKIIQKTGSKAVVEFNFPLAQHLEEIGKTPLPPYIKNCPLEEKERREKYQTVYAKEKGAIAAPTAGLHFTPALLQSLKQKGVEVHPITLHTGIGTFQPVRVADPTQHRMEAEYYEISSQTAQGVSSARANGKRIVAVGTTVVRALETAAADGSAAPLAPLDIKLSNGVNGRNTGTTDKGREVNHRRGWTDLFIYPGYKFKIVDRLITNFHFPCSTLLMLVSAFAGEEFIQQAYQEAIKEKYRFYSFGDAMLIL